MSLQSNRKPSTWSAVNLTLMSCKLERAIWSRDTGQLIPYFDRCQLIVTWMADIEEVHGNQGCIYVIDTEIYTRKKARVKLVR